MSVEDKSKITLSTWASAVLPSPTLAIDAKAKELKAKGEDICGLAAGEPDFDTPEFIKEACKKALDEGKTKYIATEGLPELRAALAQKYMEENLVRDVKTSQIVVSPGGKFSCYLAILAVCSPGDEVIVPAPFWVSYPEMVRLAGAVPKIVLAGDELGFKVTTAQLKAAITPKTRLIILNSPSNPTGAVYSKEELEAIVELALSHNIFILSDEIYEHLVYDKAKHYSPASFSKEAADRVITVSGFSKTFAMTGWRIGTLMACEAVAKAVAKLQSQTTSNSTSFAQYGALAAIENKIEAKAALDIMKQAFDKRRLLLLDGLNNIKGVRCLRAEGAFYLLPKISSFGKSSIEFASELLEKEKVALVPGSAFGADEYVRLSYATSEVVLNKSIERITKYCQSIK
jgi:aspartate aminotransferase